MKSLRSDAYALMLFGWAVCCGMSVNDVQAADVRGLFLGDNGHHQPRSRFAELQPVLQQRGVELTYTDKLQDLNPETLGKFDFLVLYANIDRIEDAQAKALLDFVANGKGFVPLHCATYCFRNNDAIVALMGAQFQRHGGGVFRTNIANRTHPIMKGFGGFESWDETYVHHLHNEKNRTVLAYRVDSEGREPWTWVRTHGKGRVFYTAWGHDARTWRNPGFQNLVERGIRWAAGGDPAVAGVFSDGAEFRVTSTKPRTDVKPFDYIDVGAKIPNYTPGKQWGTQDAPLTKMQKPLAPAESAKHFITHEGFRVELFASEPNLGGKPIAMNWDERGRLWVCETYDYPNQLQPEGQGRDRIRICEDTDGDGRADKFTLFADRLSIPTAITHYRGGVIVQDGRQTLFLKDTNGDDKADIRKVLISNWALGDTHGGVSNFQYGLDNWIWAMQGYNFSEPVIQGKKQQGFRMGFFRFRLDAQDPPNVIEIEFVRSTNNNTWGLGQTEEGIVFGSTANRNPSVFMPIANRYYERVLGWSPQGLGTIANTHLFQPVTGKVRQVDQHGGYTAGAGHAIYTARRYPQQWWNRTAFVCGPTGHLVGTFLLNARGADFTSRSPCNLIASDDEWSAPIMAEVGPDGNVWVLDWYNYIVQHNPTPRGFKTGKGNAYESDLRDKKYGRIYRVVYGAAKAGGKPTQPLALQHPDVLVASLTDPTMLVRKHAQRLLVERGQQDVVPQLVALIRDPRVDEIGLNVAAIHALQTLDGLGVVSDRGDVFAAVAAALKHPSAGVRRNAVEVLPRDRRSTVAVLASGITRDSDSQVRLAALLALAEMPANAPAGNEIAAVSRQLVTEDRWAMDALTAAAAAHASAFMERMARDCSDADGARNANRWLPTLAIVSEHFARSQPKPEALAGVLLSLSAATPSVSGAVLDGIAKGWQDEHAIQLSAKTESQLVVLLNKLSPSSKAKLIRLASVWGSRALEQYAAEIVKSLLQTAGDRKRSTAERVQAAAQVVEFRPTDDQVVQQLLELVTPQERPEIATGMIAALTRSRSPRIGDSVLDAVALLTPSARKAAFGVLLARPETTRALLASAEAGKVQLTELALDQQSALRTHPDEKIKRRAVELLRKGGNLPDPDREKVLQSLLPLTEKTGSVQGGLAVFKKHCAKCHKHNGFGESIGPDLTGMAVHPKHELLTHIIDPSRSVEGNFRIYSVATEDGQILTGMLASESRTSIELIDAEAKRHTILREDIDELRASKKSLMPEGFEKSVKQAEIADLLEYLTHKGRFVPLSIAKIATAISTKGLFHNGDNGADRMIFPDWKPKVFAGVPFLLTDPQGKSTPNLVLLHGPLGSLPPGMPKSVALPCNTRAEKIHLLSGVSGWGFPYSQDKSVSMIVRLHYDDGQVEDHPLINGVHFADYIRRVDVPKSQFAYLLRGQQIRHLLVEPKRDATIEEIAFVKGPDQSAPMIMAVTVERKDPRAAE